MTPKQKRMRRDQIDDAKKVLSRWEGVRDRMTPGTMPHNKASDECAKAKYHLDALMDYYGCRP